MINRLDGPRYSDRYSGMSQMIDSRLISGVDDLFELTDCRFLGWRLAQLYFQLGHRNLIPAT
jgi:hypothetical protein